MIAHRSRLALISAFPEIAPKPPPQTTISDLYRSAKREKQISDRTADLPSALKGPALCSWASLQPSPGSCVLLCLLCLLCPQLPFVQWFVVLKL